MVANRTATEPMSARNRTATALQDMRGDTLSSLQNVWSAGQGVCSTTARETTASIVDLLATQEQTGSYTMANGQEIVHAGPTDVALALRALARFPERTAFVWDDGRMSYAQTARLIGGMQTVLLRSGLASGDCVAILSSNRVEYWCAIIAVQSLGAAVSNLHPLGPRADHAAQIDELVPTFVIVDAIDHGKRAEELEQDCPAPVYMVLGGGSDNDLAALARAYEADPIDRSRPGLPATVSFTGGTTGQPKSVIRTASALAQISLTIIADLDLPECPIYLAVAPISHVGGTKIVPVLMRGGTIHLARKFDPAVVLETIEKAGINMTLMVPTMIYSLLDHPSIATRDLRECLINAFGCAEMAA